MIPDKLDTMNSAIKKNSHNETHVIVILLFDQAEILVRYCAYDSPNIRELCFLRSTIKTKRREYVFFFPIIAQCKQKSTQFSFTKRKKKLPTCTLGHYFVDVFHVSLILDRSPLKRKKIQCF